MVKIQPSKIPQNLHTSPSTLHLGMANFSRLPDNTPTPHQATAHRVFGRDLDSWKGFTQRSFFCRPEFYSHLIGKKKRCARFIFSFWGASTTPLQSGRWLTHNRPPDHVRLEFVMMCFGAVLIGLLILFGTPCGALGSPQAAGVDSDAACLTHPDLPDAYVTLVGTQSYGT